MRQFSKIILILHLISFAVRFYSIVSVSIFLNISSVFNVQQKFQSRQTRLSDIFKCTKEAFIISSDYVIIAVCAIGQIFENKFHLCNWSFFFPSVLYQCSFLYNKMHNEATFCLKPNQKFDLHFNK